jgi:hypothetical protein
MLAPWADLGTCVVPAFVDVLPNGSLMAVYVDAGAFNMEKVFRVSLRVPLLQSTAPPSCPRSLPPLPPSPPSLPPSLPPQFADRQRMA